MKKLLIFTAGGSVGLNDVTDESNIWILRHYEQYFQEVYVIHLLQRTQGWIRNGNTLVTGIGTGKFKHDIILAPWRLYRIGKLLQPEYYLVSDLVWAWWLTCLLKLFLRAKIFLLPIVLPEVIYEMTNKSLSVKLPIWIERRLVTLSYRISDVVITGKAFGNYAERLLNLPLVAEKIRVADSLVEAVPPPAFFEHLDALGQATAGSQHEMELLYVGRLSFEKMVDHLIRMMAEIVKVRGNDLPVRLTLVGDGAERPRLEALAQDLGVKERIQFAGYISNGLLPQYYRNASVFVSPLTGCSLREAALCGLPIIAYDLDWIHNFLEHGKTALLLPVGDYQGMAREVICLLEDSGLRNKLSENARTLAWQFWSPLHLRQSLETIFDGN